MKRSGLCILMIAAVLAVIAAGCSGKIGEGIDIRNIDGVPVLMENGMPYFTRFQATDHLRLDLSGTWKFERDPLDKGLTQSWHAPEFDDRQWYDHPVPGCWNVQKPEWLDYVGAGWYRRRLKVPGAFKGRFTRLVLDGVAYKGDVYLNGRLIGSHSGGFTQWCIDVTDLLNFGGENTLAVRVDNRRDYETLPPMIRPDRPLGFWPYGGINRLVMLESGPATTVAKLVVDTDHEGRISGACVLYNHRPAPSIAKVNIRMTSLDGRELKNLAQARVSVSAHGMAVFRFQDRLAGIQPWSPRTPGNRYRLEISADSPDARELQSLEIGFRKFEFRGTELFFNGKKFYVHGINRHEDDPKTGAVQTDARIAEDISLLHDLHANYVRTAHYPDDPRWLDACDREGILIETEIPLYQVAWSRKSLRYAEKNRLYVEAGRELIEMIERDRNHPAVVMWAIGDECFTFFPSIRRLYQRLYRTAKWFDPSRPVTFAIFVIPYGFTPTFEISAGLSDVLYVNQYLGWYFRKPEELDGLLEKIHMKWPDKPVIISEMGGSSVMGLAPGDKTYPVGYGNSRDYSENFQLNIYRVQLPILKSKPYVVGVMPWVFADFRDDKRPHAPIPNMNLKGLLTYDRRKKQVYSLVAEFFKEMEQKYGQ